MSTPLDGLAAATRTMTLGPPDNISVSGPAHQPENLAAIACASCGLTGASLRCAVCKLVAYCSKDHQKAHWAQHKHYCVAPFQMGVHAAVSQGGEMLTPAFIPQSAASDEGLADPSTRRALADILECKPDELHVVHAEISPICASHGRPRIVLVFDRVPKSAGFGAVLLTDVSRLCGTRAISVSNTVLHVLVFYLESGRDFLVGPDYRAATALTVMWKTLESPKAGAELAKLFELHDKALSVQERGPVHENSRREFFDCIVFPALSAKPFITKLPLRRVVDKDDYPPTYHQQEYRRILGDSSAEHVHLPWRDGIPAPFPSPRLSIKVREVGVYDGSPPNRSVWHATKGRAGHPWSGNIVVQGLRRNTEMARDVTVEDMDLMIEYLSKYGSNRSPGAS